jgi:hypothetical protein
MVQLFAVGDRSDQELISNSVGSSWPTIDGNHAVSLALKVRA